MFAFNCAPDEGVRRATLRGASVLMIAQVVRQGISLIGTIVVARYLTPSDFGLVAMVVAPLTIIEIIREFSLMNICVQASSLDHDKVNALFWINTLAGAVGALLVILGAPVLASFCKTPNITFVAYTLAVGLFIASLSIQHYGLLRRQMRFVPLAFLETMSTAGSVALGIGAAVLGWGYGAILIQILSARILSTAGSWILCNWRPTFSWHKQGVWTLVRNGAHLTGSTLTTALARSLDAVVLARVAGAHSVGLYTRGLSISLLPVGLVEGPLSSIAVSALSRLQYDPKRSADAALLFVRTLTTVMTGLALLLALVPELVVEVVLGRQWREVTPLLQALAFLAVAIPLSNAATVLATAYGRLSILLRYALVSAIVLVMAVIWGAMGGSFRLAIVYSIASLITSIVSLHFVGKQVLAHHRLVWYEVCPSLGVGLAIWMVVTLVISQWPIQALFSSFARLALGGALYALWSGWYLGSRGGLFRLLAARDRGL